MKESSSQSSQLISTDSMSKTVSHISTNQSHPRESFNVIIDLHRSKIEDLDRTISETDLDENEEKAENQNVLKTPKYQTYLSSIRSPLNKNNSQKESHLERGRWTPEEHALFLEGLVLYGNEWKQVQRHIKSRSATQARSHAQKFFIKLRKMVSDENSQESIKEKICDVFISSLGEQFKPLNLEGFLSMMQKLIFTSEQIPLSSMKEDERGQSVKKEEKTIHKIKLPVIEKKEYEDDNQSEYSDLSLKPQIFTISKDCSRKTSFNCPSKETSKIDFNINKFSSITKSIQNNSSCINFVTINMVNNSQNNYLNQTTQTVSEPQIQIPPHFTNTNNLSNKKERKDSTPFNIQFDDLLGGGNTNKSNGYSFFDEQYNSDFTSLLNMWN